ncbi:MAG TPA: VOC family protein [Candidatus Binatia bacterium]|jgi:catechol 2,3-dioxygenase-like lactoylglutathione lyase family enzyme
MAKIKHIAIRTADPEKTAAFYQELFGLKKAGLGRNGIYLTDGHINLAILKGNDKLGIEHLGFQVEDVDGTLARLERLGGKSLTERVNVTPKDAASPQSYYEIKCLGPDDQIIDVSGTGWVGTD